MACVTFLDNESLLIEYRQTKDVRIRNILIEQNMGLVRMIAHKMSNYCTLPYEELVQIGTIGLIKAVERFDSSKKRKFSTLAIPFIQGGILQWLRDKGRIVKVPRSLQETHRKIKQYSEANGIAYVQAGEKLGFSSALAQEAAIACTQHLVELPRELTAQEVDSDDFEWEPLLSQLPPQHATIIRGIYIEAIPTRELARSHSLKLAEVRKIEAESIQMLRLIVQGRVKCPGCGSYQTIKNGTRSGKQSYRCRTCERQFVENPLPVGRPGYGESIKNQALLHLKEGKSLHWCETYLGIDHSTAYLWAKSYGIKGIKTKASRKSMTTPVQQQWQLIGKFNNLAEWLTKNCPQSPQLDAALQSLNDAMRSSQEAVEAKK